MIKPSPNIFKIISVEQVVVATQRQEQTDVRYLRAFSLDTPGQLALDLAGASPLDPTRAGRPGPAWFFVCQGLRPCTPPGALLPCVMMSTAYHELNINLCLKKFPSIQIIFLENYSILIILFLIKPLKLKNYA